jgi:hypothetical protein
MTRSQIVIAAPMGGSVITDTLKLSLITIQILKDGFVPSTLTLISTIEKTHPYILQISYEPMASPADEYLMLSTWAKSHPLNHSGDGLSIVDPIHIKPTFMSRLKSLPMRIVRFLTFRYWGVSNG